METYRHAMHRAARDYFTALLNECGGDVRRAAAIAGTSVTTVWTYITRTKVKEIRTAARGAGIQQDSRAT